METIQQKNARLRALREARDGTPEQIKARHQARERIRKAQHQARQDILLRAMTGALVRQLEDETGVRAPESVHKFIKGE